MTEEPAAECCVCGTLLTSSISRKLIEGDYICESCYWGPSENEEGEQ